MSRWRIVRGRVRHEIAMPSIGSILPIAHASSTFGAGHCPTVPASGSAILAKNSLSGVVMPNSTSRLARMIRGSARRHCR